MQSITLYLPHIGFYLAFFFVFTYYFATIKNHIEHSEVNNKNTTAWHSIAILYVLMLSNIILISYPLITGALFFDDEYISIFSTETYFLVLTLITHVVIYAIISMVGYSLMNKMILLIKKNA